MRVVGTVAVLLGVVGCSTDSPTTPTTTSLPTTTTVLARTTATTAGTPGQPLGRAQCRRTVWPGRICATLSISASTTTPATG